jgi:hypothetical protein
MNATWKSSVDKPNEAVVRVKDYEGDVHYEADAFSGNVTLCGRTDWIGVPAAKPTRRPVNCSACKSIVSWVALIIAQEGIK